MSELLAMLEAAERGCRHPLGPPPTLITVELDAARTGVYHKLTPTGQEVLAAYRKAISLDRVVAYFVERGPITNAQSCR